LPGDDGSVGGKVKAAPKNFARHLFLRFFPAQGEAAQTHAGWCLFADWGKGATPTSFRLLFFFFHIVLDLISIVIPFHVLQVGRGF
jgi:hypothetical protein